MINNQYDKTLGVMIDQYKFNYHEARTHAYQILKDMKDPTNYSGAGHDLDLVLEDIMTMIKCKAGIDTLRLAGGK